MDCQILRDTQDFTADLGQSLWGHFIIWNPKFGCLLTWDLESKTKNNKGFSSPDRNHTGSNTDPRAEAEQIVDLCTLSFMSRSFTMKLATRDLRGAANCSGASWARWPSVVNGVMSCSRLAGSRPLCRGWTNTNKWTFDWLNTDFTLGWLLFTFSIWFST